MKRRHFLRGVGSIVVGLPFLESLAPLKVVKAQTQDPARRFVCFFTCNGANMDKIWPQASYGALSDAHFPDDRTLAPLRSYKDKLLVLRNLHMAPMGFGWDPNTPGCDHKKGMGQKLTGRPLDDAGFATGISLDQLIAKAINPAGRAAMTLGVHHTGGGGTGSISYRGAGEPITSESNPRLAFQDLMGINYGDPQVRNLLSERRKSVLDVVHADFARLDKKRLGKADRDKLELHFSTIRDIEVGLGTAAVASASCVPLDASRLQEIQNADQGVDITSDLSFKAAGRMQMDLIALALACDHTRSATLQWGSGSGGPIFNWDGMSHQYNHHKLSHGNTMDDDSGQVVDGYQDMIYQIDRWFAGEFAYLLGRLSAYGEGTGSVLDNSCVLWINELSDGKAHDFRDLPCVMAGSAGGRFKQGRFVNLSSHADARSVWPATDLDAPHTKLLTTIANAVGAGPIEQFGDASYGAKGEFSSILA